MASAIQRLSMVTTLADVQVAVGASVREIAQCDGATFVLRDGEQCYYADEDAISPLWKGRRFPLEACISGWAMLNKSVAVVPDIYADPRIPHDAYRPTFVRSLVMMPIRSLAPIGALGAYWAHEHAATDQQIWLLRAVAEAASLALEKVSVQEELQREVALSYEAHRLAQTDELTGLLNRRGFAEEIGQLRASGRADRGALAFIDVNGLKVVNDADGHAAGDRLITSVVGTITGSVRPGDVVGRLGGDEFAVFAPDTEADALRDRLAGLLGTSASVGAADLSQADDLSDVLLHADADMYVHKRAATFARTAKH